MKTIKRKVSITAELMSFLWTAKLWWMIPIVISLLALGAVLIVAQGSAIAPFIYTLF